MINLALDLASTIHHDGRGGVTDDLADAAGLTTWVRERAGALGLRAAEFAAGDDARSEVVALRAAVRALFAYAVRPEPPGPADVHQLPPPQEALDRINRVAARVPATPRLEWPVDGAPSVRLVPVDADPAVALAASLARAAVAFLSGPDRANLRACTAPRCVRYFVKDHGRQEFCKPACGNRARVARHYQRRHTHSPQASFDA